MKKNLLIMIAMVVLSAGSEVSAQKKGSKNDDNTGSTESVTQKNYSGTLVKKDFSKSIQSYCAQGSDYYILETDDKDEIILKFEENGDWKNLPNLVGEYVYIEGEMKTVEHDYDKHDDGGQHPMVPTFGGGVSNKVTCEFFMVNYIEIDGEE